jgi:hypothetical protein
MAEPANADRAGPAAWAGQALLYGLFAAVIGVFSAWPTYRPLPADQALLKLSFGHAGKPVAECRQRDAAELAKLPPNMRAPLDCPRERSPVTVELDIDGRPALREVLPPSGLKRDGASSIYRRIALPAGTHRIAVRLKDDARATDFTHRHEQAVTLEPAQIAVIDFDAATQRITVR